MRKPTQADKFNAPITPIESMQFWLHLIQVRTELCWCRWVPKCTRVDEMALGTLFSYQQLLIPKKIL